MFLLPINFHVEFLSSRKISIEFNSSHLQVVLMFCYKYCFVKENLTMHSWIYTTKNACIKIKLHILWSTNNILKNLANIFNISFNFIYSLGKLTCVYCIVQYILPNFFLVQNNWEIRIIIGIEFIILIRRDEPHYMYPKHSRTISRFWNQISWFNINIIAHYTDKFMF